MPRCACRVSLPSFCGERNCDCSLGIIDWRPRARAGMHFLVASQCVIPSRLPEGRANTARRAPASVFLKECQHQLCLSSCIRAGDLVWKERVGIFCDQPAANIFTLVARSQFDGKKDATCKTLVRGHIHVSHVSVGAWLCRGEHHHLSGRERGSRTLQQLQSPGIRRAERVCCAGFSIHCSPPTTLSVVPRVVGSV